MSVISIHPKPSELITSFLSGKSYSKIGMLMDVNTVKFCYPLVKDSLPAHEVIIVEAGEEHKNLETCQQVWDKLTRFHFDRHSILLILGGGVIGDLGGFCAATFKRGIDFVLLPTTLLAQVDASVGGKLGIDFQHYKNHIGVFCEPAATLISPTFLISLPERELRSGFAEVIKHCLISDRAMWEVIRKKSLANQDWNVLIPHSVAFKKEIVETDPKESGLRKILNFGHTVGHAVESYFLSTNRIFHGEAIAVGMICESFIGWKKNLITKAELDELSSYLGQVYPIVTLPSVRKPILDLMSQDKKNKGNRILMALTKGIGQAVWDMEVSTEEIDASLEYYQSI
ncbi:MAG: 3-dehydroquinate synthase [Cyclobacteriaceae bacterium]|nr:3-dehydroquinate synthase [Cyclobacteriaceae bacterium]